MPVLVRPISRQSYNETRLSEQKIVRAGSPSCSRELRLGQLSVLPFKVALSLAAIRTAAGTEAPGRDAAGPYRLTGPATPLSSLRAGVYQMPEALTKEMAVRANEEAARQEISTRYAYEHRYRTVGQVLLDGKFFAEVNEAGGYGFEGGALSGLSEAPLDPRARVEEIARAAKGMGQVEVRYADFVPGLGGWEGPAAPESMLPSFTARDIRDIFAEAIAANKRQASAPPPAAPGAAG